MKAQSTSPEGLIESSAGIQNKWTICAGVMGVSTLLLAGYQFVLMPLLEPADSAAGSAVRSFWPFFAIYLAAMALALAVAPKALTKAQSDGKSTGMFSLGCLLTAVCGGAMSLAVGANGIGENVIHFYWNGLAIIWVASIAMVHLSEMLNKPLAVRDWVVYSYAMLLLPLTIVPSLPIWPMLFELDAHQTIVTATTSSFAAHFLVAHYVIFEVLERREKTRKH